MKTKQKTKQNPPWLYISHMKKHKSKEPSPTTAKKRSNKWRQFSWQKTSKDVEAILEKGRREQERSKKREGFRIDRLTWTPSSLLTYTLKKKLIVKFEKQNWTYQN